MLSFMLIYRRCYTKLISATNLLLEVMILVYIVSAILFVLRTIKGPTVFDRVIAVDSLSYDLVVFMALIALYTGRYVLAACMVPIALWAYALDIYVSRYVEQKVRGEVLSDT